MGHRAGMKAWKCSVLAVSCILVLDNQLLATYLVAGGHTGSVVCSRKALAYFENVAFAIGASARRLGLCAVAHIDVGKVASVASTHTFCVAPRGIKRTGMYVDVFSDVVENLQSASCVATLQL